VVVMTHGPSVKRSSIKFTNHETEFSRVELSSFRSVGFRVEVQSFCCYNTSPAAKRNEEEEDFYSLLRTL
jgi:hypothetical protein